MNKLIAPLLLCFAVLLASGCSDSTETPPTHEPSKIQEAPVTPTGNNTHYDPR